MIARSIACVDVRLGRQRADHQNPRREAWPAVPSQTRHIAQANDRWLGAVTRPPLFWRVPTRGLPRGRSIAAGTSRCPPSGLLCLVLVFGGCAGGRNYEQGRLAEQRGEPHVAYDQYCKAAAEQPRNWAIADALARVRPGASAYWEAQGLAEMDAGRYGEAWRNFMKALEVQPDSTTVARMVRQLEEQHGPAVAEARAQWLRGGDTALAQAPFPAPPPSDRAPAKVPAPPETALAAASPAGTETEVSAAGTESPEAPADSPVRAGSAAVVRAVEKVPAEEAKIRTVDSGDLPAGMPQSTPREAGEHPPAASTPPPAVEPPAPREPAHHSADEKPPEPARVQTIESSDRPDEEAGPVATETAEKRSTVSPPADTEPPAPSEEVFETPSSFEREEAEGREPGETVPAPSAPRSEPPARHVPDVPVKPVRPQYEPRRDEFLLRITLSKRDKAYPRRAPLIDGIDVRLEDTDSDLEVDLDLYRGKERIKKIRELTPGRSQIFEGNSGTLYQLKLLGVHHKSRTVRIAVRPA